MTSRLPDTRELALAIAENSVQGIVLMDEAGNCLYANKAWEELTGFSCDDMQAKPVHDWVHHHYPDGRPFPIEECPIGCTLGQNRSVRNHRDLFFKKDGSPINVSCAASPIVKENGTILKILEIRDITEDVKAERRKDEFLAMLAHELRNPLAPISSAAELLRLGQIGNDRAQHASAVITRQVGHMAGLIDDLLDVSRVTRGLIELSREHLDIKAIVFEAIEQVRPLIESRQHRLNINTLPESAAVFGDKKRLVQVMANILNNAAKYTPNGGAIDVAIAVGKDIVQITVADNGIGMTAEMTERAFDLFSQAQRTPDRQEGGLGIGLALVRSLVSLHGGTVTAHSDGPGKGSVLKISLPRLTMQSERSECDRNVALPVAGVALKVMVVDDSVDAANMLGMMLSVIGHDVRVEFDPYKALEVASNEAYDVFLLDVGLPGMQGNELAYHIRQRPMNETARIIAVTGYGQTQHRCAESKADFDHYLVKPVSLEQINVLLNEIRK